MTTNDLNNALAFARSAVHDGDPAVILSQAKAACRTLADEIVQLNAIIREQQTMLDKLPKTADGVPIVPGMRLYSPYDNGRTVTGFQLHGEHLSCVYFDDGFDRCVWSKYSTREAAQAAERSEG